MYGQEGTIKAHTGCWLDAYHLRNQSYATAACSVTLYVCTNTSSLLWVSFFCSCMREESRQAEHTCITYVHVRLHNLSRTSSTVLVSIAQVHVQATCMTHLIVCTVSLSTLHAFNEVSFSSLSHCHLWVSDCFFSVLLTQLLHLLTSHLLQKQKDDKEDQTDMQWDDKRKGEMNQKLVHVK